MYFVLESPNNILLTKSNMKRLLQFSVLVILYFPLSYSQDIKYSDFYIEDTLKVVEKVFLHIDRDSYYPGDDIWFKAYLIDGSGRLLSSYSKNLHVELISPSMEVIYSRIIKLDGGLGNGDFHLNDSLKSGRYRLRAYTNYMRNFGNDLFFYKNINIINSRDADKFFSESPGDIIDRPDISFYPEGGSLADNVVSNIAFKALDAQGAGYDVSGEIYSSANEKITDLESTHKGMGIFSLAPAAGLRYYAIIKNHSGDRFRYELPESFSTGVVLTVSLNRSDRLSLIFRTNPLTLPLLSNHDLSLSVSEHNRWLKTYTFRMNSLNSVLNLPTEDIPSGIIKFTLSGVDGIPLCERLVFRPEKNNPEITLGTSKILFNKRDSVSVRISLADSAGKTPEAFLSLSATDNIFTDNSSVFPSTISSWFLLESEVRGVIEDPSYYFDPSNPDRLKDLDVLLLTQGWRDFEWKYKTMKYPPEYGFTISGRARKKFSDSPLKNPSVTLGLFSKEKPLISTVPVDSSGKFQIDIIGFSGEAKCIASVTDDKDNLNGWLILDSTRYNPPVVDDDIALKKIKPTDRQAVTDDQPGGSDQPFKKTLHTFIQYVEFKNATQKKYKLSDTISLGEVKVTAIRTDDPQTTHVKRSRGLYNKPDLELIVTPQMQHYSNIFHLIQARIPRTTPRPGFFSNPMYLLDGIKVDPEVISGLPVSFVERIDVLDNLASYAVFGSYGYGAGPPDGAINIITRTDGPYIPISPVYHSANIKFTGYNEPRIFYSPVHHTTLQSDYKPDLRTTLFWKPDIRINNKEDLILNFYNSDNSSTVKITVEGITSTGVPVSTSTKYEVK